MIVGCCTHPGHAKVLLLTRHQLHTLSEKLLGLIRFLQAHHRLGSKVVAAQLHTDMRELDKRSRERNDLEVKV
jgi:hypothetical protein